MSDPRIDSLLNRPAQQRILEFKYRFAQAVVFGLPVVALQWFGQSLGGSPAESQRWIAMLQAVLSGWVTYVGAAGMLAEGLMLLSKRFSPDLPVALAAVTLYLYSAVSVIGVFGTGHPLYQPLMFHWVVILIAVWSGGRWARLSKAQNSA